MLTRILCLGLLSALSLSASCTDNFQTPDWWNEPTYYLQGLVLDSASRAPIEGASVSFGGKTIRSDASGNYKISDPEKGDCCVTAEHEGYKDYSREIHFSPASGYNFWWNIEMVPN